MACSVQGRKRRFGARVVQQHDRSESLVTLGLKSLRRGGQRGDWGFDVRRLASAVVTVGLLVAGCATIVVPAPTPSPTPPPRPSLNVGNGTSLEVTLTVNGSPVGVFPAGGVGPTIDVSKLPPLPWQVGAQTSSGRLLTFMTVKEGDGIMTVQNGVGTGNSPMGRVDLSCGRLTIWAGDHPPSGPVPPSPAGSPGDCAP